VRSAGDLKPSKSSASSSRWPPPTARAAAMKPTEKAGTSTGAMTTPTKARCDTKVISSQ